MPPPPNGSADNLLNFIQAYRYINEACAHFSGLALVFIKGQNTSIGACGVPLGLPSPTTPSNPAYIQTNYYSLRGGHDFALDVDDRIRLREGRNGTAGLWLFQTKPKKDCAFIGMAGDEAVGFWGHTGMGWGLVMNTTNGMVGIGTIAPTHKFHVFATDAVGLFESSSNQAYLRLSTNEGLNNRVEITNRPGGRFSVWTSGGGDALNVTRNGNVGIGTIAPTHKFHVVAPDAVGLFESSGSQAYLRLSTTEGLDNRVEITNRPGGRFSVWTAGTAGGGGDALSVTRDGNVGIGTAEPQARLHVNGKIIATEDIVLQNADCAEEFAIANLETIEPGTVMVLGEEDSLCESTKAYDKRVAGVVSGAGNFKPGLILDKQPDSTNRMPIALMGKVYCKVDAQYAPIEVGDLLTTSPTPGHAMKATDPTKAFGTIIGKALKPLGAGTGLIPILVALQ